MKKARLLGSVCGLLVLAGCASAPPAAPARVLTGTPISCPNNAPNDPPQCNVVVTMSMPTSTSCAGNVPSQITFGSPGSAARNIPIVWTLSPLQSGSYTFKFANPGGITINSDPQNQLSQPQGGNSSTTSYTLIDALSQVSTMTYSVNVTASNGGVMPLVCSIADPRIINSN